MSGGLIVLGIVGTPGLVLCIVAVVLYARTRRGAPVIGEVIGHSDCTGDQGVVLHTTRYLVVVDGRHVTGIAGSMSTSTPPPVGTRAALRYDATNPESPLATPGHLLLVPGILFGVGLLLVALGIGLAVSFYESN